MKGIKVDIWGDMTYNTLTGENGYFFFPEIDYGEYTLRIETDTYDLYQKTINPGYFNNLTCKEWGGDIQLGRKWEKVDTGISEFIKGIEFADANNGWLICGEGLIYHTEDGGDSWIAQTSGVSSSLYAIDIVDVNNIWVCGIAVVLNTSNGGDNWNVIISSPVSFNDIEFIDNNHGWVLGVENIYETLNGGNDWTGYPLSVGGGMNHIQFIDANTGWCSGGGAGRGVIFSDDSGHSWEIQYSENYINKSFFIDSNNGWAVGSRITSTQDGGQTWTDYATDLDNWLNDVYFINSEIGWAVGRNGTIIHTIDGGQTWDEQKSEASGDIRRVYFYDSTHGWIVDSGGVFKYCP